MINKYICPTCQKEFDWDDSEVEPFIRCPHCTGEMRAPTPIVANGTRVGDYVIQKRIGIGGMGEVYLAEQLSMQRPVAMKILQEELVKDKAYLERFFREVRTLALIEHPNIVRAIETGYDGNIYYFSMTFIEGKDIKRLLEEGRKFTELESLRIIRPIADALRYVWEKHKLLHRDIKPANIMLTPDGDVKLMDLGISKRLKHEEDIDLTIAGMMVGSPQYVSPEQAKASKDIDFGADMYSLGGALYHILTGEPPYPGDNAMAVIASHLSDPVPDPRRRNPLISEATASIVMNMMAKKKEDRYLNWDDCIDDMDDTIDELSGENIGIATESGRESASTRLTETQAEQMKSRSGIGRIPKFKKMLIFGSPLRIAAFGTIFILCIVCLLFVIKKGIRDSKRDKAAALFQEAIRFSEANPDSVNFRKTMEMFDVVRRAGDPYYASEAKAEMAGIVEKAKQLKKKRQLELKKGILDELKKKSYDLEKKGEYDKAISSWESYLENGPHAKEFEPEIKKAVEYLKRQRKLKEDGLLEND